MAIKYVAYTWLGQKVEGVLDSDRREDAVELLERQQLIPYRVEAVRPGRSLVQLLPALFRPGSQQVIEFTRGTAALLRSGIPLRQTLGVLRDQSRDLSLREVLRQVIHDVEAGERFSVACSRHPTAFPNFYTRLLTVGEAGGGMAGTMQHLADTLTRNKQAKDKVRGALTYPAISVLVALVAAFVLIRFALPALVGLLAEYGGQLPLTTRLLIASAHFLQSYTLHIVAGVLILVALIIAFLRTRRGARLRDRLLLRTPVVGGVLLRSNLFGLTSTFSVLLEAGISPIESLQLSGEALSNVVLRERLARVTAEAEGGTRLGQAFSLHWAYPPLLSQGIVTGEAAGTLAPALHSLAEYYEQETARVVGAATELIQPVIILLVGGLVGFMAVAMISGIYSTLGSVK